MSLPLLQTELADLFSTSGWQLLTFIHVDQHADTLPEHAGMSLTYWLIGGFPYLSIRIGAIAINDITATIGQKPSVTHAKKSIATFKLREGMKIGCKVTLRKDRM